MDYCTQTTDKESFIRNLKQLLTFAEANEITDEHAEKAYRLSWALAIFCLAGVESNVIERRIRG